MTIDPNVEMVTNYLAMSVSRANKKQNKRKKQRKAEKKRFKNLMNFFHTHLSNKDLDLGFKIGIFGNLSP